MIRLNDHYFKLQASYLFADIGRRVAAYQAEHPQRDIIKLGIGDVTRALPDACVKAFHRAVDEMAADASFRGYGPEQGYAFLRERIAAEDFQARGADISADEIFVSDGAKCDTGNFLDILSADNRVGMPDPVYPVYVDTNVMAGHTGEFVDGRYQGLVYLEGSEANAFVPPPPEEALDLIYLCYPNNPTGAVITREQLTRWVEYALAHKALILYDAAYAAFIRDERLPRSIYEIKEARKVAVEFRSFSKTAGFTGTRCAYTVVPRDCMAWTAAGEKKPLHALWTRRHTTKFNGVSYPVQRAAEAVYSTEGREQTRSLVSYYLENAGIIRAALGEMGFACIGGENSPYIWVDCGGDAWAFFDRLLERSGVVCTPGDGFGRCGRGHVRISAFNDRENVQTAMARMREAGF